MYLKVNKFGTSRATKHRGALGSSTALLSDRHTSQSDG